MALFLLLFGHVVLSFAVAEVHANPNASLQCTNDLEKMSCQRDGKNCVKYNLTLHSDSGYGNKSCNLQQCDIEKCCCDVNMILIIGENHIAIVQEGEKSLESQTIGVKESFKPRTPTIISVKEIRNNIEVTWMTNMETRSDISLIKEVQYFKKGGPEKVWYRTDLLTGDGFPYYEINGEELERDTAYVVRVRSFSSLSGFFSDTSKEWEFKTSSSYDYLLYSIVITCSVVAIICLALYCSYGKLETKWCDEVPKPKIPTMDHSKKMMLQPEKLVPLHVSILQSAPDVDDPSSQMPLTDSESVSSSTDLSVSIYAEMPVDDKVDFHLDFPKLSLPIIPVAQPQTSHLLSKENGLFGPLFSRHGIGNSGSTSGSSDIVNSSYSLFVPNTSNNALADSPPFNTQTPLGGGFSLTDSMRDTVNTDAQDPSPARTQIQNLMAPPNDLLFLPSHFNQFFLPNISSGLSQPSFLLLGPSDNCMVISDYQSV